MITIAIDEAKNITNAPISTLLVLESLQNPKTTPQMLTKAMVMEVRSALIAKS